MESVQPWVIVLVINLPHWVLLPVPTDRTNLLLSLPNIEILVLLPGVLDLPSLFLGDALAVTHDYAPFFSVMYPSASSAVAIRP